MKTFSLQLLDRTTYVGLFVASLMITSTVLGGVAAAFERQAETTPFVSQVEEVVVIG